MARSRLLGILLVLGVGTTVACGQGTAFDPSGPCTGDGRAPGAYPELEAEIPRAFDGRSPAHLDSGRNCTGANLGTLARAGIEEVRFAGGVWELDARSGVTLALLTAPGLTQDQVADFYHAGAIGGRRTEDVERTAMTTEWGTWDRIETLNDESYQTIVVMQPLGAVGRVHVALIGSDIRETQTRDVHEGRVRAAVDAWQAEFPID